MSISSLCVHLSTASPVLLGAFLDIAIKGMAILLLTSMFVLCMRRASAAARHLVWFLGTLGLLILPILTTALPGWRVSPRWTDHVAAFDRPAPEMIVASSTPDALSASDDQLGRNEEGPSAEPARSPAGNAPAAASPLQAPTSLPSRLTWQAWTLSAWLAGCRVAVRTRGSGVCQSLVAAAANLRQSPRRAGWFFFLCFAASLVCAGRCSCCAALAARCR